MGSSTRMYSKVFEAALRDIGGNRLRLEQVIRAYQQAFPADAMKPDMRKRLHDAIIALSEAGVLTIPEGSVDIYQDETLPKVIEMTASASFVSNPSASVN